MGHGDLAHIFADLDFGDNIPLLVLHSGQLVHAAEHRLAPGGDHPLTHAEHIDLRPLKQQILNQILVQGIGNGYFTVGPAGIVQHFPGLAAEVGHVAGVQANAALGDAQRL